MATATELLKECRICALTFVNPKLLPCHHTFCETCVAKLTKQSRLTCPNCRKICHTRDIVPDFRLDEFLQALRELEESLCKPKTETTIDVPGKCENCREKESSNYCKDCDRWICTSCMEIHLNTEATWNHQIQNLESKNEELKAKLVNDTKRLMTVKVKDYESVIAAFQRESNKSEENQLRTLSESQKKREKLQKEIGERFDAIDNEILSTTENYISQLEQAKEKCARNLQCLEAEYKEIVKEIEENPQIAIEGEIFLKKVKERLEAVGNTNVQFRSINFRLRRNAAVDISKAITLAVQTGSYEFKVSERGNPICG